MYNLFAFASRITFSFTKHGRQQYCISIKILIKEGLIPKPYKLDVLRGRLLGSQNNFHWQLGGQINHQPCSRKQLESVMHRAGQCCFELLALISSPQHINQRYSPSFFCGFLDMCGVCGSSIESWRHFFKHPQLLGVSIVLPSDTAQTTRWRVLSALSASDCLALQTSMRHLQ